MTGRFFTTRAPSEADCSHFLSPEIPAFGPGPPCCEEAQLRTKAPDGQFCSPAPAPWQPTLPASCRSCLGSGASSFYQAALSGHTRQTSRHAGSESLSLSSPWDPPGQNTGVGSLSLLQWLFPTQGSNRGLLHCRRILCRLSHLGSPKHGLISKESLLVVQTTKFFLFFAG